MSKYKSLQPQVDYDDVENFSEIFNALSHPHRLKIFLGLASRCKSKTNLSEFEARACVSDAGKGLNIAPSTLSHHIKELRRVGLVRMEKSGQTTDCWVEQSTIKKLQHFFSKIGCA